MIELFNRGVPPDAIQREHYPTLTLEEVYATITYYLHNKAKVDEYNRRGEEVAESQYQEYLQKGPYHLRDEAPNPGGLPPGGGAACE